MGPKRKLNIVEETPPKVKNAKKAHNSAKTSPKKAKSLFGEAKSPESIRSKKNVISPSPFQTKDDDDDQSQSQLTRTTQTKLTKLGSRRAIQQLLKARELYDPKYVHKNVEYVEGRELDPVSERAIGLILGKFDTPDDFDTSFYSYGPLSGSSKGEKILTAYANKQLIPKLGVTYENAKVCLFCAEEGHLRQRCKRD